MNMISTGAFQIEMDASNKQPTLAEKFAAVWEKKNAKAARAGGVSLMALSLAACGSDDTTTTSSDTTTTTTTTTSSSKLTNGTDTVTASGTIDAGMVWSPGGDTRVESLQSEDTVTGSGTADVINVTSDGGSIAPKLLGVETVNYSIAGATAGTLNVSNSTGITAITASSTDGDVSVVGLSTGASLAANNIADAATNAAFQFKSSALSGTADSVTVSVDGFLGNNLNVGTSAAATTNGAGIETLTLNASGETSSIANVGSTGVTTLNIDADAKLTISALAATGVTTLDLTGSTAVTSIDVDDNVSANIFAYTGGSGDDTIIANSGFAGTDSFDGGDGADTLSIRPATGTNVAAVGALNASSAAVFSNIETLDMRAATGDGGAASDFTVDMDTVPSVTAITMRTADTDTKAIFTLNDLTAAQAGALTMTHTGTDADTDSEIIVDMKENGTDTVKLSATVSADTQVVELNDANNNIENAEITLAGAATTNLDVDVSSFGTSLKVSGGVADETLTIVNAHTSATVDMSAAVSDVTMTLGAGTQTANFGTGDDTITMASGAKTVDVGAGADTVSTTVALVGATDTITGGEGTDTLKLTTIATVAAASFANVSGFERLSMNQADLSGDVTIDLDNFNTTFARISIGDTNDQVVTIDNAPSSFTDLRYTKDFQATPAAVTDSEFTLNRKTDTLTDAVTLTIAGGNTVKTLDLADEETITFTGSGTGTATITAATVTDAKSMVFTGSNTIAFANSTAGLVNEGQVATIDASALTGALTINASASIVNMTATGNADAGGVLTLTTGAGADTVTGGFAGDTINTGIGNDTISGGAGIDTIDGDAGNDTYTGGSGADIMITGEGNDTITDFTFGASGDQIRLDLSGIEAIKADGTNVINLIEADLDAGTAAATNNIVANVITGATDLDSLSDGGNLLVLNGTVSESGLLTALAIGGSFALTLGANLQNDEAILVLHTDGTNAYLKTITNISGSTINDSDTLTVAELSADLVTTFSGVSSLASYNADNDTTIIA